MKALYLQAHPPGHPAGPAAGQRWDILEQKRETKALYLPAHPAAHPAAGPAAGQRREMKAMHLPAHPAAGPVLGCLHCHASRSCLHCLRFQPLRPLLSCLHCHAARSCPHCLRFQPARVCLHRRRCAHTQLRCQSRHPPCHYPSHDLLCCVRACSRVRCHDGSHVRCHDRYHLRTRRLLPCCLVRVVLHMHCSFPLHSHHLHCCFVRACLRMCCRSDRHLHQQPGDMRCLVRACLRAHYHSYSPLYR